MDLEQIHSVYFIGIGGIGMSAQAIYFRYQGKKVAGYDKTQTPLTDQLDHAGIPVHYKEDIHQIPFDPDLVVITPAIPSDNKELVYLTKKGYPVLKRSEVLGMLTKGKFTIAVAGTHGKTTITALITHLLKTAGIRVTAFIGGISRNYDANLVYDQEPEIMIVEADEYDRSFLTLEPDIALISAIDADHLDIYGSYEHVLDAFKDFSLNVKPGGHLVIHESIQALFGPSDKNVSVTVAPAINYVQTSGFTGADGLQHFDITMPDRHFNDLALGIPGRFNLENSIMALSVVSMLGVDEQSIRQALRSFRGVNRRFDFRILSDNLVYIDDYAHHPRELNVCIQAARELYPGRKLTGIFQPHLFSRTRDFADEFAQSLQQLDEVILLEIYPAREMPINNVTSEMLLEKITSDNKSVCKKGDLVNELKHRHIEVLLSLGAGDIDQLVGPIETMLINRPDTSGIMQYC